jgi:hypothetical protein
VGGDTADTAAVQLHDRNGTGAQQRTVTAAHHIVDPAADRRLDAAGNGSAGGTRPQIRTRAGGADQK